MLYRIFHKQLGYHLFMLGDQLLVDQWYTVSSFEMAPYWLEIQIQL